MITRYSRFLIASALLVSSLASADRLNGQPLQPATVPPAEALRAGIVRTRVDTVKVDWLPKPNEPPSSTQYNLRQIVVKFHEGTGVRLKDAQGLRSLAAVKERLQKRNLTQAQLQADLEAVVKLVGDDGWSLYRHFADVTPKRLDELRAQAESSSSIELADLNLYYSLHRERPDAAVAEKAVTALMRMPSVEVAYIQPIPKDADIAPTTTIDLRGNQGYAGPAPNGINTTFANTLPGGKGEDVRIVDVEGSWIDRHEDQPAFNFTHGLSSGDGNHGTAVIGVLAAQNNEYGITGLVASAQVGWSSVVAAGFPNIFYSPANAITSATDWLRAGDVMLIEQHYPGPTGTRRCDQDCGNCDQFGYVAMEYFPAEFDAISLASALNIVVVEAAGNGQMNLNAARYRNRFNPQTRDSGAILVGAADSAARTRRCWSNHGTRVDAHGWGQNVATLGYGTNGSGDATSALRANGSDSRQFYTRRFSGTSSATPIVAAAATALQGINKARRSEILTPRAIRTLLATTGTPQTGNTSRNIGPLPNLTAAIAALPAATNSMGAVVRVAGTVAATGDVALTINVRNDGGTTWNSDNGFFVRVSGGFSTRVARFARPVSPGASAALQVSVACPAAGDVNLFATLLENNTQAFGTSRGVRVRCVAPN